MLRSSSRAISRALWPRCELIGRRRRWKSQHSSPNLSAVFAGSATFDGGLYRANRDWAVLFRQPLEKIEADSSAAVNLRLPNYTKLINDILARPGACELVSRQRDPNDQPRHRLNGRLGSRG